MVKKIVAAIILGSLAIGMTGCGGSSEPTKDNSTKQEEQKKEEKKTEFKIGETINLDNMILIVESKEISQGTEFEKPKDGQEFVVVKIKIENKKDKNISYNPFDFKLQNSKGQIVDKGIITIDNKTALQSGNLAPGGHVEGTIAFEAPKGDTGLQLQYTGNMFDDNAKITVNLQ